MDGSRETAKSEGFAHTWTQWWEHPHPTKRSAPGLSTLPSGSSVMRLAVRFRRLCINLCRLCSNLSRVTCCEVPDLTNGIFTHLILPRKMPRLLLSRKMPGQLWAWLPPAWVCLPVQLLRNPWMPPLWQLCPWPLLQRSAAEQQI